MPTSLPFSGISTHRYRHQLGPAGPGNGEIGPCTRGSSCTRVCLGPPGSSCPQVSVPTSTSCTRVPMHTRQFLHTHVPMFVAAAAHRCLCPPGSSCTLVCPQNSSCRHACSCVTPVSKPIGQLLHMHVPMCAAAPAHLCAHVCNSLAHVCVHVHSSPFSHVPARRAAPAHTCVRVFRAASAHIHVPARQAALAHSCAQVCDGSGSHVFLPTSVPMQSSSCTRMPVCEAAPVQLWAPACKQLLHTHVMSTHSGSCTHTYLWSSRQLCMHVSLPAKQLLHKRVPKCGAAPARAHRTAPAHVCVQTPTGQLLHAHVLMCAAVPSHACSCLEGSSCTRVCPCL